MQSTSEEPSTSTLASVGKRVQSQPDVQAQQQPGQQQVAEQLNPAEQRRKALQQFLIRGLVDIENFVLAARHFIIPRNSLADKLPFINSTPEDAHKTVVLSARFQSLVRAQSKGLPPSSELKPRPKHRFIWRHDPGIVELVGVNFLLCYTLTKLNF